MEIHLTAAAAADLVDLRLISEEEISQEIESSHHSREKDVSTGANKFTTLSLAHLSVSLSSSESQENVRTSCNRGMSSGPRNGLETSAYISVEEIESCEREKEKEVQKVRLDQLHS